MSAKAYDKHTAAFAGFVIQHIPADLDGTTMQGWMDNPSAMKKFLSGLRPEEPARSWREEGDVIYFSVTSDGSTGEDWIKRLECKGFRVGEYAKQVLRSPDFKSTSGVTTEVAVLKGIIFDNGRTTKKIRAQVEKCRLGKPNAELACLIREKFTDEEIKAMGLWQIVPMHEPINDSTGTPYLLSVGRLGEGRWLDTCCDQYDSMWGYDYGFAFLLSENSTS